jgi:hypothetical protein
MKGLKMKSWFFSLKGALTLSIFTIISEAWRSFLDAMFVLPVDFGNVGTMNLAAVIFTLLFTGWIWLLHLTANGSKRGLIGLFILNAIVLLGVPVSWLLFYCPIECRADAGIFNLANTLNLVFGALAGIALGIQIWSGKERKVLSSIAEA